MTKQKNFISVLIIAVLLVSTLSFLAFTAIAEIMNDQVPSMPTGNTDFTNSISSFSNDLWGVDADTYLTFNKLNKTINWKYFNGAFLAEGFAVNSEHKTALKANMALSKVGGRFDLIFKAKTTNDYFAVYIYDDVVKLFQYKNYVDTLLATSEVAYTRAANQVSSISVATESGKVSVWINGIQYFKDYSISDTGYSVCFGMNVAGLTANTDTITVSDYSLYYTEDESKFNPKPVKPVNNKDLIDNVTGLWFPYSTDATFDGATDTIAFTRCNGGCHILGMDLDIVRGYVIQGLMNVPTAGGDVRLQATGSAWNTNIGIYMYDNKLDVYQVVNGTETVKLASGTYTRTVGVNCEFTAKVENNKLSVWIDGTLIVDNLSIPEYNGGYLGVYPNGYGYPIANNKKVVISSLDLYYTQSDLEYVEEKINKIPEITRYNFRTEKTASVKTARSAVDKLLATYNGVYTTDNISNYSKLTQAENAIAEFEADPQVTDILAVEEKINLIPAITEENYQAELDGSIADAEEAVDELLAKYNDLSYDDISNYGKLAEAKEIAQNGGVAKNLLYYATGIETMYDAEYEYDAGNYTMSVTKSGLSKFKGVSLDTSRAYVFEADITNNSQSDIEGWTRIAFKGTDENDYLYLGFSGTGVYILDPVNGIEQNFLGIGSYTRKVGEPYHVKVITTPETATVIVNENVVINRAEISNRYTGEFFSCYTYQAKAVYGNLNLYYYSGEEVSYENVEDANNLMYNVTSINGAELGTGFYGNYESSTRTLKILSNGFGGEFCGATVDMEKPYVYSASVVTLEDNGEICLVFDGDNLFDNVCVSIGTDMVSVYDLESSLQNSPIATAEFNRVANQKYEVIIYRNGNRISVIIDGVCYIKNAVCTRSFTEGYLGAYGNGLNQAIISNLNIHYADSTEIEYLNQIISQKNNVDNKPNESKNTLPDTGDGTFIWMFMFGLSLISTSFFISYRKINN